MDWIAGASDKLYFTPTVNGIYRVTIISDKQFNITRVCAGKLNDDGNVGRWVSLIRTALANNEKCYAGENSADIAGN